MPVNMELKMKKKKKNYLIKLIFGGIIAAISISCLAPSTLPQTVSANESPVMSIPETEKQIVTPISKDALSKDQFDEFEPNDGTIHALPTSTSFPIGEVLFIDAGQPGNPFSNEMLGVALSNWEHSWGKLFPGDVPGLANILKGAHIGLVRYAGGLWANWVGWERLPQRTPYTDWVPDPANYHPDFQAGIDPFTYSFHYGQDEIDSLAKLSQESGVEVMVQVNVSNNDPEMWADMAHYSNVEKGYGFKYWELGNEFDLECRDGSGACVDADTYKTRAEEYIAALHNVDSSLNVVGGVPASGHAFFGENDYTGATTAMSPWLVQARDAGVQSLSFHWYTDCYQTSLDNVFTYDWGDPYTAWQNTYSRKWSKIGPERVEAEIIEPGGVNLTQGITELNIDACDFGRAPVNSNHINAVWMADVIGRLGYNGLDYMTWYTGYGTEQQGYPAIATVEDFYEWGGGPIYLRPSYYTLFLFGNFFGDQYVHSTSPDEERLSIWASTDSQEPGALKIIVVNISDSPATEAIAITGYNALSGKKYTLSNANPLAMSEGSNGPDHGTTINGMTLTPENILGAAAELESSAPSVSISGSQIVEEFPPYSVTAIVLQEGSAPPSLYTWLPFLTVKLP